MTLEEYVTKVADTVIEGECPHCYQSGFKRNPECDNHHGSRVASSDAANKLKALVLEARACLLQQ